MTRALPFILILYFVSCAGIGKGIIEPPGIYVERVEISKLDPYNQELLFDIKISNPNSFPLPVRGISYRLYLNGVEFANGYNSKSVEIPSNSINGTTLVIKGDLLSFLKRFKFISPGGIDYSISGNISVLSTDIKFPYTHKGKIDTDIFN